ncbi:DsbA family protein [Polyangium mundeleinium]|uniref:Thioredoxin domain-containing protein n=1 Tax=Polyangium mundeleinium TaxID=2995306 RepID=A0ABT5F503_9BACT|nr:thioredoxin domain-containing protein [Polyangium mundeleinium]MDC0749158.1 thioredoxin domain-containing protein [Polyangium mundeleinium]
MALLRWSPLLLALLGSGGACHGSSDQSEPKPAPSATPDPSVPGIELGQLTPRERRDWTAQVSTLLAPCAETPVPISQCIQENRPCKACFPAAQFLLKQVQAGRSKQEREEAYTARFDPKKVRTLVTDGSPELGPPDAPVTIVEWADFECPACRAFYPVVDDLVKRFPGQVRAVYKFYPLGSHPHGEISARAANAAFKQGKFWEMHHLLFDNQDRLEQSDLERYAKKLELDVAKFRVEMNSDDTSGRIEKDKKQADGVGLQGTPTVFINGREVELGKLTDLYGDLEDWIKLDLELAGIKPAPAPAKPAASAMPAAGSAMPAAGSAIPAAGSAVPAAGSAIPAVGSAAPSTAPAKK